MMGRRSRLLLSLFLLVATVEGCGDTGPPRPGITGTWVGETSQIHLRMVIGSSVDEIGYTNITGTGTFTLRDTGTSVQIESVYGFGAPDVILFFLPTSLPYVTFTGQYVGSVGANEVRGSLWTSQEANADSVAITIYRQ